MMERCDGGQYMYLPTVVGEWYLHPAPWLSQCGGERGERGESRFLLSSLLFSLFASLSLAIAPSPDILTREYNNKKPPRKEKKEIKWRDPKIESPIQSVHVLHKVSNKATYLPNLTYLLPTSYWGRVRTYLTLEGFAPGLLVCVCDYLCMRWIDWDVSDDNNNKRREGERGQGVPAREWYRPAFYREAQERSQGRTGKTKLGRTLQRASLAVCSPSQKGIVLEFWLLYPSKTVASGKSTDYCVIVGKSSCPRHNPLPAGGWIIFSDDM